jgi:hypothetical protein
MGDIDECYCYGKLALWIFGEMPATKFVFRIYGAAGGKTFDDEGLEDKDLVTDANNIRLSIVVVYD